MSCQPPTKHCGVPRFESIIHTHVHCASCVPDPPLANVRSPRGRVVPGPARPCTTRSPCRLLFGRSRPRLETMNMIMSMTMPHLLFPSSPCNARQQEDAKMRRGARRDGNKARQTSAPPEPLSTVLSLTLVSTELCALYPHRTIVHGCRDHEGFTVCHSRNAAAQQWAVLTRSLTLYANYETRRLSPHCPHTTTASAPRYARKLNRALATAWEHGPSATPRPDGE